jgi:glycosyltransferase involved in cell wall biosynthesis
MTRASQRRILLIGKYPPIQGGVSAQTYRSARELAERGWAVHVVTNANEVEGGFRVHLIGEDQNRLELRGESGSVTVHATVKLRHEAYIPWAPPYASQLFGLGATQLEAHHFDLIVGWYFEPYCVVAAQLASTFGIPLLICHAGSDLGKLAAHPDLAATYRWVISKATGVLTSLLSSQTRELLAALGARDDQLRPLRPAALPAMFRKRADPLDVNAVLAQSASWFENLKISPDCIRQQRSLVEHRTDVAGPTIGVYGKVGVPKGTGHLLDALASLAERAVPFRLLFMGGGRRDALEAAYRSIASNPALASRTTTLPLLAPWRVPSFLRACDITCFLEHQFPVSFHAPRIPREILASGSCLVTTREVAEKQPFCESLVDGKNVILIDDPSDVARLEVRLERLCSGADNPYVIGKHGLYLSQTCESFFSPTDAMADAVEALVRTG